MDQMDVTRVPTLDRDRLELDRSASSGLHGRLLLARLLLAFLPIDVGSRLRAVVLKRVGFQVGHGTLLAGLPAIAGPGDIYGRLSIGQSCFFNAGCFFDLHAEIVVGDYVSLGQQVMLLTWTAETGLPPRPVRIEAGVWLGARSIILPGVTVGRGAIVAAGAVVAEDVPPDTLVGGVPAGVIRLLDQAQS